MGVAALVLGIISVLLAFIPVIGLFLAPIPAVIGLILGLVDWKQKKKAELSVGISLAGTILSGVALLVIVLWIVFAYAS